MKNCSVCKVEKPESDFNWRNKAKGWLRPECRECHRAAERTKRAANRDTYNAACKERKRKWRAAHPNAGKEWYAANREKELARHRRRAEDPVFRTATNERSRQWIAANKEKHRAAVKAWTERNKKTLREYHAQYALEHRKEFAEKSRKRRALKLARTVTPFTLEDLNARMSVFGHCCAYCSGPFEEVDHVIPLSRGGLHCLANLRPACQACNRRKWATPLDVWLSKVA